ncbi:Poly [ADP-ribose] polymerase 14 [Merluccius polli]|uniref:Poly [ADP-ribose] polymerase n=1 Tax=Merluccius polli TaxID=89951 RepID=A0AA47MPD0_MERPO|nr:Poly [ADP-ribose] polymerase 14 [Merluccius polli]
MSEIGSVSVILKKADITKETVDVIVNSNNQTLDLNTGKGGINPKDSAKAILQGVKIHLSSAHHCSSLKKIFVVAFEDQTYDSVKKYFNKPSHIKIQDALIEVKQGDITAETVKAIVNRPLRGNDAGVTSGGGLQCDFIIHIVGPKSVVQAVERVKNVLKHCEDKNIPTVSFPAIGTGGGGLKFKESVVALLEGIKDHLSKHNFSVLKQIFLVVDQVKVMQECQQSLLYWTQLTQDMADDDDSSCEEDNSGGTQPLDGVVITKPGNLAAKHIIHMVGQTKEKDITSSMLKVFKMCEEHKIQSVAFPALGTAKISVPPTRQSSLCLASVCRDVSFPKVEVEVHGCCSSDVAKVKELVDDLVTNECKLYSICSPYMHNLLDSEIQAIVTLSKNLQVCVSVSAPDKATASGKVEDALTMVREIEKYLQTAKEWTIRQEEENRLREMVRWEVSDGETWAELSVCVSLDLERAMYEKKASISYTQNKQTYTVNLKSMEQRDRKGTITRIKRTLKADSENEPPPNWDRMGNKTLDVVDLSPTSKQYKVVAENFLKTSKDPQNATSITFTVVKIQRIQSKEQWQRYAVKKQMLDKKYPKNKNEIDLYHGTTAEICQKVNNYGFNRSFYGRNAIAYGKGTYFGKQSWYSCNDQYSSPDAQGVKYMYQARVLVGKPCLGVTNMVEPTPLDPSNPLAGLHDCAVDNIQNPFIYVVFSDAGAYPEYLISFKKA